MEKKPVENTFFIHSRNLPHFPKISANFELIFLTVSYLILRLREKEPKGRSVWTTECRGQHLKSKSDCKLELSTFFFLVVKKFCGAFCIKGQHFFWPYQLIFYAYLLALLADKIHISFDVQLSLLSNFMKYFISKLLLFYNQAKYSRHK